MKSIFNNAPVKIFVLVVLSITAFAFTARFGLDSFEVYLNNKLILKQSVNQPLNLRVLQLGQANDNDELRIAYKHCQFSGAGSDRKIVLQDEKGNILKKWEFANTTGKGVNMAIPVKELLQLEKNNAQHDLSLHYSSKELSKSETIAFLHVKK